VAMLTVNTFNFISFPFGIATAATIRVGNLLGAREPQRAAVAAWVSVALGGAAMAVCAVATAAARRSLGRVFIDDAAVAALVASIAPLGALLQLFDGIMGTAQVRALLSPTRAAVRACSRG
jgi:multidrug resistance protein, MATE family